MADLPHKIVLEDGTEVDDTPKLRGLLQSLIASQEGIVKANQAKQAVLHNIESLGYDKRVAQAVLMRRNRKQLELDIFDSHVQAYERVIGWRDPDMDLAEEAKKAAAARKDHIDETTDQLGGAADEPGPARVWPLALDHDTGEHVQADSHGAYPEDTAQLIEYPKNKTVAASLRVLQLVDQTWIACCSCECGKNTWATVLTAHTAFTSREAAIDAAARDVTKWWQDRIFDGKMNKGQAAVAPKVVAWMAELLHKHSQPEGDDIPESEPSEPAPPPADTPAEEPVF